MSEKISLNKIKSVKLKKPTAFSPVAKTKDRKKKEDTSNRTNSSLVSTETTPLTTTELNPEYKATLSTIFSSFSGVATKNEYRRACRLRLLVFLLSTLFYLLLTLADNDVSGISLFSLFFLVTGFINIWNFVQIRNRIKRFHAFGHSYIISFFIPGLTLYMLSLGLVLSSLYDIALGQFSASFTWGLFVGFLAYIFMVIWECVLFFGIAPCDGEKSFQTAACVCFGFVILSIIALGVYSIFPEQESKKILKAKGVKVKMISDEHWNHFIRENDVGGVRALIVTTKPTSYKIGEYMGLAVSLHHTEIVELLKAAGAKE